MHLLLIRRASERGHFKNRWLDTHYTFSFADYEDEDWMGFRTLRVINEDVVAPGKGFDLHGHRDMEILTYVMRGSLRHVDTMGNNDVIQAGEFQLMTAGAGVQHMELNASQTEDCHLYQIWILPNQRDLEPSYSKMSVTSSNPENHPGGGRGPLSEGILIASPDAREGSLKIHQSAEIRLYRLEAGQTAKIEVPDGKGCWVQVVEGEIELGGEILKASDGVGVGESFEIVTFLRTEMIGLFV